MFAKVPTAGLLLVVSMGVVGDVAWAQRGQWWNPPVEEPTPRKTNEAAVRDAIAYLIERQEPSGGWDTRKIVGDAGPAISSLVVMALSSHVASLGESLQPSVQAAIDHGKAYLADAEIQSGPVKLYQYRMQNWNNALMALCWLHLRRVENTDAHDGALNKVLAALLASQESEGGWTYSANWSRGMQKSTTIQTPFVLLALAEAKRQGFDVPKKTILEGLRFLRDTRRGDGSYRYSLVSRMEDGILGSCGRMVGAELAKTRLGQEAPLAVVVKNFMRWRDALEVTRSSVVPPERRRAVGHWGEENTARYYFFSGHWLASEALRHLDDGGQDLATLRDKIRLIQEKDGSFRDSSEHGWVYSTAMALNVFADVCWLSKAGEKTPPPHPNPPKTKLEKTVDKVALSLDADLKKDVKPVRVSGMALYGLALLSEGSTPARGPHADRLAALQDRLLRDLPDFDVNGPEAWWAIALGTVASTELYRSAPSLDGRRRFKKLQRLILDGRKKDGGWPVHGYGDITVHTCLMTVALVRLEKCGVKLPPEAKQRLVEYLEEVTYADGAVEYGLSHARRNKKKGITSYSTIETAARNASVLLALLHLDMEDSDLFRKVRAWYDAHTSETVFGHASPQYARLMGGIANYRLGPDWWKRFRKETLSLDGTPRRPRGRKAVRKIDPEVYEPPKGRVVRIGAAPVADSVFGSIEFEEAVDVILHRAEREKLDLLRKPFRRRRPR